MKLGEVVVSMSIVAWLFLLIQSLALCIFGISHGSVDYRGAPFRTIFETWEMLDFTNKTFL